LAVHRNEQDTPLGYVFIYFYGLDWRGLIDHTNGEVNVAELKPIYKEVNWLRTIYGSNQCRYGVVVANYLAFGL
jgi:hypothetical protein